MIKMIKNTETSWIEVVCNVNKKQISLLCCTDSVIKVHSRGIVFTNIFYHLIMA